jgi:hypothetical protein
MCQKIRKERITKVEWYNRGGFANSALFRKQSRGGAWRYYVNLDRAPTTDIYQAAAQEIASAPDAPRSIGKSPALAMAYGNRK